jgi:hypothetical protein
LNNRESNSWIVLLRGEISWLISSQTSPTHAARLIVKATAYARFYQPVLEARAGKIAKGSVLIVENPDRISRQKLPPTLFRPARFWRHSSDHHAFQRGKRFHERMRQVNRDK